MRSADNTADVSLETKLSQYDPDALWENLFALGASPGARHRSISVGLALAAALRVSSKASGREYSPLSEINELVNFAARSYDISAMHEDYVPLDPAKIATLRIGNELLNLTPGFTERPIADLSRAIKMAEAVDPILVERHGFGLFNLVRVTAKYVDQCVRYLSDSWVPAPTLDVGQVITLPSAEVRAVQEFQRVDLLKEMDFTATDRAALEWMSTKKSSAIYDPESPTSPFGRFIRFHKNGAGDTDRWVPPAYVPEIMAHAVAELLDNHSDNKLLRAALRNCHLQEAERALWRFSNQLVHAPALKAGDRPLEGVEVAWLLPVNNTRLIAISAVYVDDIQQHEPPEPGCLRLAIQSQKRHERPLSVMTGGKMIRLVPGLEIVPLVLIMGNSHLITTQQPGLATVSLEDLIWISQTATDSDDLYHFIKELASTDGPSMMGFETINFWEVWRGNGKSLYRGGKRPSLMVFASHAGDAEWDRAVELSKLEVGLFEAQLPALRDTQFAEIISGNIGSVSILEGESEYSEESGLCRAPKLSGWSLTLLRPVVAIRRANPDWKSKEEFNFLFDVCGGLVFAFLGLSEQWQRVHSDVGILGYKIELSIANADEKTFDHAVVSRVVASDSRPERLVSASWAFDLDRFVDATNGKPSAANHLTSAPLLGTLEHTGIGQGALDQLIHAWKNSKPFLVLEAQTTNTHFHGLPPPWTINEADESAAVIAFGKRLYSAELEPGDYRGQEANQLLREYLAPLALAQLQSLVHLHSRDDIILSGLEQLNRVIDTNVREEGNLSRVAGNLETDWDPNLRLTEVANESLQLRQSNEIIIEAAMQIEPNVTEPRYSINKQRWSSLLAAADSYRTITLLSEQLHYRVVPLALEITFTYELQFKESETIEEGIWNFDGEAMNEAASRLRLANISEVQDSDDVLGDNALAEAMRDGLGAAPNDLFDTLMAVVQWKSFDPGLTTARTTESELLNWITSYTGKRSSEQKSRYRKAISLLTLTPKKMWSSDWSPWKTRTRRHRLLVEPFVLLADGGIHVAPQYAMASLHVYHSYLTQGMLPWSSSVPKKLERALASRRADRNKRFESILEQSLRERGFHTLGRVKVGDHARLGVPELSTEIDLVCGIPGRSEIWLIEAKDPATIHGYAEIARQLDTFFRDAKRKGLLKPCYASQLARKDAEVRPYLDQVAEKLDLGLVGSGGTRQLRTLFITRNLIPASFANEAYEIKSLTEFLHWVDTEYIV